MDSLKIGQIILELRKRNNLTQAELAKKLCVTSQAVSKWENGRGLPDIDSLKRISKEFDIDMASLLDGKFLSSDSNKIEKKNIKSIILLIAIVLLIISLTFTCYFFIGKGNSFKFSNIKSLNTSFEVKGVVAYSNDKKSIYISDIFYVGNDKNINEYVSLECSLYEKNNSIEKKIAQFGKINFDKDTINNKKTFKELLSVVEFSVDDYSSTCKELLIDNLYIIVNVLNIDNKVITYKIPLQFDNPC